MKLSYDPADRDEKTVALAGKIVELLINNRVTYQKANDALTIAQEMLLEKTIPTII